MNAGSPTGHFVQLLYEEWLMELVGSFSNWRIDGFIRQKGRILPFVRGLRLSALLIYAIREMLTGTGLTANWGHLTDASGTISSPECDVIIHREGHIRRWNGHDNPIMDFRFIDRQRAVAVISCKSYLTAGHIDREYCTSMQPFVSKIWLFAECCGPRSVERIQSKALECGYEHFWHLYLWSKQKPLEPNKEGWNEFVEEVKNLAQ